MILKEEDISVSHTGTFISLPSNHTGCLMIFSNLFLLIPSLTNFPIFTSLSYYRLGSTCHSIFLYFLGSCLVLWNIFSHLPRSAPLSLSNMNAFFCKASPALRIPQECAQILLLIISIKSAMIGCICMNRKGHSS